MVQIQKQFPESREVNLLSPHKSIPVRIYPEKKTLQNKQVSKQIRQINPVKMLPNIWDRAIHIIQL